MSSDLQKYLIKKHGVENVVNKKIFMYSKENYNYVNGLDDLPECIRNATDHEIEATSPFKSGASI
jgi:hypothetical protein